MVSNSCSFYIPAFTFLLSHTHFHIPAFTFPLLRSLLSPTDSCRIQSLPGIPEESNLAELPANLIKQFQKNVAWNLNSARIVPGIMWMEVTSIGCRQTSHIQTPPMHTHLNQPFQKFQVALHWTVGGHWNLIYAYTPEIDIPEVWWAWGYSHAAQWWRQLHLEPAAHWQHHLLHHKHLLWCPFTLGLLMTVGLE